MKKFLFLLVALLATSVLSACSSKDDSEPVDKPQEYMGLVLNDMTLRTQNLGSDQGKYTIYLPADYETSGEKYPVLYLLHGMWSNSNEWISNGKANNYTKDAINAGIIGKMIIVMPNAFDSFYVDGYDRKHDYESFFFNELMPHIEATYPVKTGRENTAIVGLSMGGFGASYYAFKYPEKFCFCYAMSGAVEGMGTKLVPSVKMMFEQWGYDSSNFSRLPKYYMDCGTEDNMVYAANVHTRDYLKSVNFPFTYRESTGIHDWNFWRAAYQRMLPDLGEFFKPSGK